MGTSLAPTKATLNANTLLKWLWATFGGTSNCRLMRWCAITG